LNNLKLVRMKLKVMEYSLHAPTSEPQRRGLLTTASMFSRIRTDNTRPPGIFFSKLKQSLQSYEPMCRINLTAGRNLIVNFKFSRFSAPPCIRGYMNDVFIVKVRETLAENSC
jgi:hypothetical protein